MMQRRTLCAAAGIASLGVRAAADDAFFHASSAAPSVAGVAVPLAYFGTHFHRLVGRPDKAEPPTQWVDAMVGSLRLWDSGTRWGDVAPRAGVWNFDRMDAYVAAAEAHGAGVLYTLGSTPRWASARPDEPGPYGPGCAAEPVQLAHWEEYVRRVAERYRGRIQAYELWNEPHFSDYALDRQHPGFFTGSVAHMVDFARVARSVLDRVDPAALLTTPGFVNGPHRLDLFLRSGGAQWVQVVAYHFYARDALQFVQQVVDVRGVMRRQGLAGLPLWNTECGVETYEDHESLPEGIKQRPTGPQAAATLAQFLLLGAAVRMDRFFYYAWDNYRSGMVDRQGQRTPRFEALLRVEEWLLGVHLAGAALIGNSVVIRGARGTERCIFAWNELDRLERIVVPAGWKVAACETLLRVAVQACSLAEGGGHQVALSPAPMRLRLVRA